jgi:hypothetical protein
VIDPAKLLREMGANAERLRMLETTTKAQAADIRRLEATRNKAAGFWAALVTVGTVAGALGAILSRMFFH